MCAYDLLMGCGKNAVLDADQQFPLQILRWPFLGMKNGVCERLIIRARSWEQAMHFLTRDGYMPVDELHPFNPIFRAA
jgi:hypothetical protein